MLQLHKHQLHSRILSSSLLNIKESQQPETLNIRSTSIINKSTYSIQVATRIQMNPTIGIKSSNNQSKQNPQTLQNRRCEYQQTSHYQTAKSPLARGGDTSQHGSRSRQLRVAQIKREGGRKERHLRKRRRLRREEEAQVTAGPLLAPRVAGRALPVCGGCVWGLGAGDGMELGFKEVY
jgi:hypothetical protein